MYSHTKTCLLPGTTNLKRNSSALLQQLSRGGGGTIVCFLYFLPPGAEEPVDAAVFSNTAVASDISLLSSDILFIQLH